MYIDKVNQFLFITVVYFKYLDIIVIGKNDTEKKVIAKIQAGNECDSIGNTREILSRQMKKSSYIHIIVHRYVIRI